MNTTYQNMNTTDENKKKRNLLLSFVVSSCIKAAELGISLKQHITDAQEFLTSLKNMMDAFMNNEYNVTAYSNFKKISIKFANETRDEEYSFVKKIISIYNLHDQEEDMSYTELNFVSGFLENYIITSREYEN